MSAEPSEDTRTQDFLINPNLIIYGAKFGYWFVCMKGIWR